MYDEIFHKHSPIQLKMDQVSASKLSATQNVIKNKFKHAYANRMEREYDVNQAMKSINVGGTTSSASSLTITNEPESIKNDYSNHSIDPNELCTNLRKLLTSQIADNVNRTHEINMIVEKLRELKIVM